MAERQVPFLYITFIDPPQEFTALSVCVGNSEHLHTWKFALPFGEQTSIQGVQKPALSILQAQAPPLPVPERQRKQKFTILKMPEDTILSTVNPDEKEGRIVREGADG